MSKEEYESLMARMVKLQLEEAKRLESMDENGLETIDLTKEDVALA